MMDEGSCNHYIYHCVICDVQFCQRCSREWRDWESDVWAFGPLREDSILTIFGAAGDGIHKHSDEDE